MLRTNYYIARLFKSRAYFFQFYTKLYPLGIRVLVILLKLKCFILKFFHCDYHDASNQLLDQLNNG